MSNKNVTINFEPLDNKRNFEKIIELLKEKIFSGEYLPGDRLPSERQLAAVLRVSVLSVREAYRALQLLGMTEIRRGGTGGAFISSPNLGSGFQSVNDLFRFQGGTLEQWSEARLLLELDLGRLVIERADEKDLARLKALNEEAFNKIREGIPAHRENAAFRMNWAQAARNPFLFTAYKSMMDLLFTTFIALHLPVEHSQQGAMIHSRMLDAMESRDLDRLTRIIKEYVREANDRLAEVSRRSPIFKEPSVDGKKGLAGSANT